ncbi:hypothetical protein F2Q69_00042808 [Brassica cretica]|uniref:Retrotransposon gag domain-containing protein n=1 Tax=Brassica cretica TaxID=69181 RepID=A0A8S9NC09_BRACR|nr:hypothetical protein F2Q69_00042808 [Brassica cretica]
MPRKFSFPIIKMYDGTSNPDDHIAQYKQRMLAVALPSEFREATMCKGFGLTLIGPALQWCINLPIRSISLFPTLSDGFVEQFASSWNLEKTSDSLYEILQHRAEPFRDYIARFNQEKEDVASRARTQQKQATRQDRSDRDERSSQKPMKDQGGRNRDRNMSRPVERAEGMSVSTWLDISNLSVSQPEIINALRQIGQQVKWPPKMRAPDSFRNPDLWCESHRDHGHKTEDCVALKIEVNKLLQKGYLREFLSEKAKNLLSKETPRKSAETKPASPPRQDRLIHVISGGSEISGISHAAAKKSTRNAKLGLETKSAETKPASPPRQDRLIHVISGGSEISGISHAAAKKSTRNAKLGLETSKSNRLLLGSDEISFTAKEQEKVLAPHHDALVVSLTIANCLVRRIRAKLVSSSRFGPEKHHSPVQRGRRPADIISTCCQIPRHPGKSG